MMWIVDIGLLTVYKKIRSKSMPVGLATFSSPQKIVTKNVFEAFYDVVSTV